MKLYVVEVDADTNEHEVGQVLKFARRAGSQTYMTEMKTSPSGASLYVTAIGCIISQQGEISMNQPCRVVSQHHQVSIPGK